MDKITFKDLGLAQNVLNGIEAMGYVSPSPIQEKSIPVLLEGKDIIGQAQTGTGKTLAFGSVLLSQMLKGKVCSSFDFITNKRNLHYRFMKN